MQLVTLDINVTADHAILWHDDALHLLDQRVLPQTVRFVRCTDAVDTAEAIHAMVGRRRSASPQPTAWRRGCTRKTAP